jgi:hypothetical protein
MDKDTRAKKSDSPENRAGDARVARFARLPPVPGARFCGNPSGGRVTREAAEISDKLIAISGRSPLDLITPVGSGVSCRGL